MSHHCHATGCTKSIPPELFTCLRHWRMVPPEMRRRIWDTYRVGQCDDKRPSKAYCEAAKAAVIYLAGRDGVKPDTRLYDFFLAGMRDDHEVPALQETEAVQGVLSFDSQRSAQRS